MTGRYSDIPDTQRCCAGLLEQTGAQINRAKPSIIFKGLHKFSSSFFEHVIESAPDWGPAFAPTVVATLELPDEPWGSQGFLRLEWKLDLEIRTRIEAPNNLDSILPYETPITAPASVVFSALEFVRRHLMSASVWLPGTVQEGTTVCMIDSRSVSI